MSDPAPAAAASSAPPAVASPSPLPAPSATTQPAVASAANPPSPLDGLSPTDLRIKLEHARKNLRNQLDKKRKIDRDLATLEQSIYAFEGSYLSDALFSSSNSANASGTPNNANANAAQFGNIIRGYDSYLKAPGGGGGADRRKVGRPGDGPNEKERMFSASSATYHRSIELRAAEAAASVEPESDDDAARKKRRH